MLLSIVLGTMSTPVMSVLAAEPLAPVRQGSFACHVGHGGMQRVAFVADGPCCSARGNCVERLSTTILPHGKTVQRT